jgi:threonine dehydratase
MLPEDRLSAARAFNKMLRSHPRSVPAASSPSAVAITPRGVAYAARELGISAVICMPQTTRPTTRRDAATAPKLC